MPSRRILGKPPFEPESPDNHFFDAINEEHLMNGNGALLFPSMRSRRGLILQCRVPFRVVVDNMVCSGDIESDTRCFWVQEQPASRRSRKIVNYILAIRHWHAAM